MGTKTTAGNNNAAKSQMVQDLFPESAMNFKSSSAGPKLIDTMAFDSNPISMSFTSIEKSSTSTALAVVAAPSSPSNIHPKWLIRPFRVSS